VGKAQLEVFDQVVRALFVQPRKTIRNNLSGAYGRSRIDALLLDMGLDGKRRPSTLTLQEIVGIAEVLDGD
jgi:16S rRNA A1518/A1519 N6-dimethyltransferase RsmA/KsgA/DIM1 with predicted DNA glycosylase/AP lyase activity